MRADRVRSPVKEAMGAQTLGREQRLSAFTFWAPMMGQDMISTLNIMLAKKTRLIYVFDLTYIAECGTGIY
ncbi:MAG TPA: hypothetical protein VM163_08565 [bacterium]|nr:hypothetical protein [bacterium]